MEEYIRLSYLAIDYSVQLWLRPKIIFFSSYLQSSGSKEYAGTGDGFNLESHKHVGPQTVIHVVPVDTKHTGTKT